MLNEKRKQLPIGSVVNIHNESTDIAIIGQFPVIEKDNVKGYYDFSGVVLPIGFDSENIILFNKEDISEIRFLGYIDLKFQKFLSKAEDFEKTTELKKLKVVEQDNDK
ncbi:DUF4176 domain-containing protein [uncultured Streptococcus sp.]|uniref:DUF4176 domain-containing protein n=1 Tax=uncultured Streptococcus sp. TaxID=83427 RepID=UPI002609AEC7|nr:DUF4176 domain-containing protein [uncultured Streptococcus sp.]